MSGNPSIFCFMLISNILIRISISFVLCLFGKMEQKKSSYEKWTDGEVQASSWRLEAKRLRL